MTYESIIVQKGFCTIKPIIPLKKTFKSVVSLKSVCHFSRLRNMSKEHNLDSQHLDSHSFTNSSFIIS